MCKNEINAYFQRVVDFPQYFQTSSVTVVNAFENIGETEEIAYL